MNVPSLHNPISLKKDRVWYFRRILNFIPQNRNDYLVHSRNILCDSKNAALSTREESQQKSTIVHFVSEPHIQGVPKSPCITSQACKRPQDE